MYIESHFRLIFSVVWHFLCPPLRWHADFPLHNETGPYASTWSVSHWSPLHYSTEQLWVTERNKQQGVLQIVTKKACRWYINRDTILGQKTSSESTHRPEDLMELICRIQQHCIQSTAHMSESTSLEKACGTLTRLEFRCHNSRARQCTSLLPITTATLQDSNAKLFDTKNRDSAPHLSRVIDSLAIP